jgi:hypothetical protein
MISGSANGLPRYQAARTRQALTAAIPHLLGAVRETEPFMAEADIRRRSSRGTGLQRRGEIVPGSGASPHLDPEYALQTAGRESPEGARRLRLALRAPG